MIFYVILSQKSLTAINRLKMDLENKIYFGEACKSQTKKILIQSNYHPESFGGIEAVVLSLIKLLSDFDAKIKCIYFDNYSSHTKKNNIEYFSIKIIMKIFGAPIGLFGNAKLIKNGRKVDLIIFQEPMPTLWPAIFILRKIFNKKIIVIVHLIPDITPWAKSFYSFIRNIVFSGSCWVATSPPLQQQLNLPSKEKATTIPLSCPEAIKLDFVMDLPERFVLYFGRLANYKGIDILLQSALHNPEIPLVIAGDGLRSSEVKAFKAIHGLEQVVFLNRTFSEQEKMELIKRCAFLLFPSTTRNEAFGIIQIEAMREGKPIINTDLKNGVNFVAPDKICAMTVRPNSSEDLAAAINDLWYDDAKILKLGTASRQRYFELFTEDKFFNSWRKIFNNFFGLKNRNQKIK